MLIVIWPGGWRGLEGASLAGGGGGGGGGEVGRREGCRGAVRCDLCRVLLPPVLLIKFLWLMAYTGMAGWHRGHSWAHNVHACPGIICAIAAFLPALRRMRGSPGGAHLPCGIKLPLLKLLNIHSDTSKLFYFPETSTLLFFFFFTFFFPPVF